MFLNTPVPDVAQDLSEQKDPRSSQVHVLQPSLNTAPSGHGAAEKHSRTGQCSSLPHTCARRSSQLQNISRGDVTPRRASIPTQLDLN